MRLLLDTHFLIWLASDRAHITGLERAIIERPETALFVSAVSIWELRLKALADHRRGRSSSVLSPAEGLAFCRESEVTLVSLEPGDPADTLRQEVNHHDPFDIMLLIHAQRLGAKLLTRDRALAGHPLVYQP